MNKDTEIVIRALELAIMSTERMLPVFTGQDKLDAYEGIGTINRIIRELSSGDLILSKYIRNY